MRLTCYPIAFDTYKNPQSISVKFFAEKIILAQAILVR